MSQSKSSFTPVDAEESSDVSEYKPVSMLAVLTLGLGFASCLTLASPLFFLLPSLSLLTSLLAFRSLANSDGAFVGRKLILWGLALAAFFSGTAIARNVSRHELAVRDARQLASTFLALLQDNEPQKAHQLQSRESERQPPKTSLEIHYRTSLKDYDELKTFVETPSVRTLIALGDQATIRFYAVEEIAEAPQGMAFSLLYTVTYEEDGKPQTFFVRVALRRELDFHTDILDWSIQSYEAGVRPFVPSK